MQTIRIDIVNPKALNLLKELADMDLIRIKSDDSQLELEKILKKMRTRNKVVPTLDEITKEVETVRNSRYDA
ncbi:MAG: hypothetical protein KGZ71_14140 [Desulfobulbaceae bacterium]|nr:hypothetical protein [Candidatus Kapabacteria bacterium]MBS4001613.1 hypothetical protein [Desulfobulbaceae bacterium]